MDNDNSVSNLVETLFKYRGTNYSKMAEQLGMSRQVLFRMVKNGTLKLPVFLKMMEILEFKASFKSMDDPLDGIIILKDVECPRLRRKIGGVQYDTNKMFSFNVQDNGETVDELCFEPVIKQYVMVHYRKDGTKKGRAFPSMELISKEDAEKIMAE